MSIFSSSWKVSHYQIVSFFTLEIILSISFHSRSSSMSPLDTFQRSFHHALSSLSSKELLTLISVLSRCSPVACTLVKILSSYSFRSFFHQTNAACDVIVIFGAMTGVKTGTDVVWESLFSSCTSCVAAFLFWFLVTLISTVKYFTQVIFVVFLSNVVTQRWGS